MSYVLSQTHPVLYAGKIFHIPHNLFKCPFGKSETDFETEHAAKLQIS